MANDFLDENDFNENVPSGIDFLSDENIDNNEPYSKSLLMAIPRIGKDIWQSGIEGLRDVPGYLETAKTEISGLPKTAYEHPSHLAKQGLAGLTELGHSALNLPHSISEYLSDRLHLVPKELTESVPYQKDISEDISNLFGEPSYPGESLIRGTIRNFPAVTGASKVASIVNPLNYTDKAVIKDVLKTKEHNEKYYSKKYNNLFKEAENKGYDDTLHNVDIDMKTLEKFTPEKKIIGVLNFDKNPTLQNAHRAKSDLLKIQDKLSQKTSFNEGEKAQAKAVSDAITSLKNNMFIDSSGNVNEKLLKRYNDLSKGYAIDVVPYKNKYINQYNRNDISAKNLVNKLKEGPFALKKGNVHPELVNQDLMRKALIAAGIGTGTIYGGKKVYNSVLDQINNK